ncbi:MAG: hypothetical protein C0467_16165 [Planctomycetaceae bacterium]|nr:hypothetical protein [Planctomycetaceae bacterium]
MTTDFLRAQPVWEKLPVKSGQQGTNFPITDTDGETLLGLIERFHHEDSPGVSQWATDEGGEIVPERLPEGTESPARQQVITQRVIRDTEVATAVKRIHNFRCQVCDVRLETPGGPYAEAAHIHPLGGENPGPDQPDNVLCLCPNHHVLFDYGAFSIADDMSLLGMEGRCRILPGHMLNVSNLAYHRRNIFNAGAEK